MGFNSGFKDLKGREEGEDKDRNQKYARLNIEGNGGQTLFRQKKKKNYNSHFMFFIPQTFLHSLHQLTNILNKILFITYRS